jgi:hypothetical protein
VDTELGAKDLLNSRVAYVAVSCGVHDAQIFTNNASALSQELSGDMSHLRAIRQPLAPKAIEQQPVPTHEVGQGFSIGM